MTNAIDARFAEIRRCAFIPYFMAGYPDMRTFQRVLLGARAAGADLVEIGLPFSDPTADGPVIQEAGIAAAGTTAAQVFSLTSRLGRRIGVPLVLMSYYNLVFCGPARRFCREAARAGFSGILCPDLPFEESGELAGPAREAGLHLIQFVAPTTPRERARKILESAEGYVYLVSLMGVTGARNRLDPKLIAHLSRLRRLSRAPVCVGFGISSAGHVRALAAHAGGVIVGSRLVSVMRQAKNPSSAALSECRRLSAPLR
jgi:tryptophan synthase alpha chain